MSQTIPQTTIIHTSITQKLFTGLGAAALALALTGPAAAEPTEVKVWRHHEANEAEVGS